MTQSRMGCGVPRSPRHQRRVQRGRYGCWQGRSAGECALLWQSPWGLDRAQTAQTRSQRKLDVSELRLFLIMDRDSYSLSYRK